MKYEIFADVSSDGTLSEIKRKEIGRYIKSFAGKRISITIERKFNKRSDVQNDMWWSWMKIVGDYLGYSKNEMHELCKRKFLELERFLATVKESNRRRIFAKQDNVFIDIGTGESYLLDQLEKVVQENTSGSTTVLTTSEFMELADKFDKWVFSEFGIRIPMPGENWELNFE